MINYKYFPHIFIYLSGVPFKIKVQIKATETEKKNEYFVNSKNCDLTCHLRRKQ